MNRIRTQTPAWVAYPITTGTLAALIAVTGLFWDVAYHIEHGRDVNLLTPAHMMILAGLLGLGIAALGSIILATRERLADAWRIGPLHVPRAALPLGLMAAGAAAGFPLDDLWHRTYGIDVTLWSPTHLVMIGGGVLSTFALCLYLAAPGMERPRSLMLRWRRVSLHGAILIGLSVFLLEFDFGIPQWRAVYHPLLVAITAGIGLVAARASLGRGGALSAALFYAGLRILLALFVKLVGHNPPLAPLLIPEALLVELAFWFEGRLGAPRAALLSGALIALPGMAAEWLWTQLTYPLPWHSSLLPWMWLPALAAVAAALAGLAFGSAAGRRPSGLPAGAALLALAALVAALALPLPRTSSPGHATITATPAGAPKTVLDRFGRPATEQDMNVDVAVSPAGYARDPDWFVIQAWQGGGHRVIALREVSPGHYRAQAPVPTGGSWKAMVMLARGDVVSAAPISFPPDPEYHQAGIPAEPAQDQAFRPAVKLMLSESHDAAPWVAVAAYAALIAAAAVWVSAVALAARAITAQRRDRRLPGRPALA